MANGTIGQCVRDWWLRDRRARGTGSRIAWCGTRGRHRRRWALRRSAGPGHTDADGARRAWVGMAGQGQHQPEYAEAVLQQGQRAPLPGQAGHQLHDLELQPRSLLRGGQALRLRLVRDAAQHDVVRRGAAHDPDLPTSRCGADDSHARRARSQHAESHGSGCARRDHPYRG